ncbi:MAG: 2-oxoglutarate dehydrogenase E1 component [Cytophagales bacterium]|nr:MAG: 2-oxoglutarate dehydrogenase E1 component [Cytophagales bacterium]TAF60897.1 MAG: 2-oxoglutarate dehydrogenase E1 component [Cytophagales bacterium]
MSNLHYTEAAYIDDLYKAYKANPEAVETSWKFFFDGFEFSQISAKGTNGAAPASIDNNSLQKEVAVRKLIDGYRSRGHLQALTNPVRARKDRKARLKLEDFDLSEKDLNTEFWAGEELGLGKVKLSRIVEVLKKIYEGSIGFELTGIREPEVAEWFRLKVEREYFNYKATKAEKMQILEKLNESTIFENFLHTKFLGQKRFSLEGGEAAIAALDVVINQGAELGVQEVMVGMAHRGRLNVLANTLRKPYDLIFREFEGLALLDQTVGDGDVKYHMGYSSHITTPQGKKVLVKLAPNPSHLEAVNPVVQGFSRAKIDHTYQGEVSKMLPILIHGDAAVAGQGIVYEVTQMCNLEGYRTGGTVHFVINNQVGFTTDFADARSSIYCTDVSQIIEAPEIHVNGDDPEAVVFAARLAIEFRQKFLRDIFVDIVCYRKHGHNESDEPRFTQPQLYNVLAKHPNPRTVYVQKLISEGSITAQEADRLEQNFRDTLQQLLNEVRASTTPIVINQLESEWKDLRFSKREDFDESPQTAISEDTIQKVGKALHSAPEGFKMLKQIEKVLQDRQKQFFEDKKLTWASAELLAYGSLMLEGKMVRMTGQDVKRGTFSHRQAVLFDSETGQSYNSLNHIQSNQAKFEIYNSLLSEYGVLGFEFGYAMANPDSLVLWEAQFGDFANGAQIMIDQFITSTESKWQRMNGLVMLLPHGYEGQGPEHSNARPERFLQLAAQNNIVVANCTTPANFFHLLRRQLAWNFRKPCVVMSPKSMLRHPACLSDLSEFTSGGFREVLPDTFATDKKKVKKVVFCSGKFYYDLQAKQTADKRKDVAIVRLEQLYPFAQGQIEVIKAQYPKAKFCWAQEEPENMGAWLHILRMSYRLGWQWELVARRASASPATGYYKIHNKEQAELIEKAFEINA